MNEISLSCYVSIIMSNLWDKHVSRLRNRERCQIYKHFLTMLKIPKKGIN